MSNEECLQHAVTFVRKYGYNAKNAAKEWGLHENMVNRAVRILNTKEKLESIGVKIPHSASEEIVNRLHPVIIYGDEVLKNAAEAVFKSGVGSREVEKLAQDIKAARNEQSKLEVINMKKEGLSGWSTDKLIVTGKKTLISSAISWLHKTGKISHLGKCLWGPPQPKLFNPAESA